MVAGVGMYETIILVVLSVQHKSSRQNREVGILIYFFLQAYNPTIGFLSVCVAPVSEIAAHSDYALSIVGGGAGGEWLRKLIAIDALIVLCGGVLTG